MSGPFAQLKGSARPSQVEDMQRVGAVVAAAQHRIETWLDAVLPQPGSPPQRLHVAMRESVFPGGKRARPLLVQLVAETYGAGDAELVGRMAAAVELVHCASLVHDDLPAFDDAAFRRGKPSCQAAFGEATAILVGDALLTLSFEAIARAPISLARTSMRLVRLLCEATGSTAGIIGGQGLELQTNVDITAYHMQKTSALFRASAAGGALAAGAEEDFQRWARFGDLVGRALQLRDDLNDVAGDEQAIGKPVGQDASFGRPNAVLETGVEETQRSLDAVVEEALEILGTPSPETAPLRSLVERVAGRT